jgi:hypothetical protein
VVEPGTLLDGPELRRLRCRSQGLTPDSPLLPSPAGAVRHLVAIQVQLVQPAALAVRARTRGLHASDVAAAVRDDRSLVRQWLLRGTLHLVAADDLRWLQAALGPDVAWAGRQRRLELGLTDGVVERGLRAIADVLAAEGPLTRGELVDRLAARGVVLDTRSQAPIHLIGLAGRLGALCLGPDRDSGEPTYVLTADWLGPPPARPPDRETAVAELARRYVEAHGPAGVDDLAAWSGLRRTEARAALRSIAGELVEVEAGGERAWLPRGRAREPEGSGVRLLPHFDPYLLAYRRRDFALSPDLARRLQRGGGFVHPVVIADGWGVAACAIRTRGSRTAVELDVSEPLGPAERAGLAAEVDDLGRFLGTEAVLR